MGREADMIIDLINKEKSTQMNKLQDRMEYINDGDIATNLLELYQCRLEYAVLEDIRCKIEMRVHLREAGVYLKSEEVDEICKDRAKPVEDRKGL